MKALELWQTLVKWLEQGHSFVMATVVRSAGSVPRHRGARMLIRADGAICGTVGGGALEHEAMQRAGRTLSKGEPELLELNLKKDLSMACGGNATLLLEPFLPVERLHIFGGGHVGQALARVAGGLGFAITVVDSRKAFASPERFPGASCIVGYEPEAWASKLVFDQQTYCVVVTHGHPTDTAVVTTLLQLDPGPRYVGMIGSARKRQAVEKALREAEIKEEQIQRLHTPVGVEIGAETPDEIAVSIAAELVQVRRTLP